jgi:ferredoxin
MTTHKVALAFEDGVTRFINCREDQTVADASYRQRINIPLDCRDGACGTCKAFCESGRFDGGTYIDDALSADEAAEGFVLPCSMKPRSDLVLQIASTSDVAKTQAATYTGSWLSCNGSRRRRCGSAWRSRTGSSWRSCRAVRQHRGARHGHGSFLFVQQRPA